MRLVKNDRLRGGDMPGTHQTLPTLSLPPPAFQKHPAEGASLFAPVFCSIITRRSRRRNPLEKNSKFQALNLVMPPAAPVPRSTQGSLQTVRNPGQYARSRAVHFPPVPPMPPLRLPPRRAGRCSVPTHCAAPVPRVPTRSALLP